MLWTSGKVERQIMYDAQVVVRKRTMDGYIKKYYIFVVLLLIVTVFSVMRLDRVAFRSEERRGGKECR